MKQVAGLIATYSSDEFGICSALYEWGGMVVMHDASGCNSTYTTHDEPRWYDMDSMIFISAVSEMEAVMGDDEKLIGDLVSTAEELQPAFIAVTGAPIPYMIGTDLDAVARITEQRTGIPCFGFFVNGMQHYTVGISLALEAVVQRFCIRKIEKTEALSVNIIGATPLDFSLNGSVQSMEEWIREHGMEPGVCMAMGSTLEEVKQAGKAHVNLVVSFGGLAAAKRLETLFGTPYVVGVPFGKTFADSLAETLKQAADGRGGSCIGYDLSREGKKSLERKEKAVAAKKRLAVIGESVLAGSLAAAIEMEYGIPALVLCPLDTEPELLRSGDILTPEEDDLIRQIPNFFGVVADPLYQPLCGEAVTFYPLPHEAFSGRMYETENPNLINRKFSEGR